MKSRLGNTSDWLNPSKATGNKSVLESAHPFLLSK